MSKVFVISDLHLNHENIAKSRGFANSEEHDKYIISEWNKVVSKRDVVYILGDISMETCREYKTLGCLNGVKKVVLGNHERMKRSHNEELLKYVSCVAGSVKKSVCGRNVLLTHIPIHPIEFEYRVDFNVHGHLHYLGIEDCRYINVCPEHIGYTPKELWRVIIEKL